MTLGDEDGAHRFGELLVARHRVDEPGEHTRGGALVLVAGAQLRLAVEPDVSGTR